MRHIIACNNNSNNRSSPSPAAAGQTTMKVNPDALIDASKAGDVDK